MLGHISPQDVLSSENLKYFEQGCNIQKLNKKKQLKNRFFRFDFAREELVANSRELMKREKTYPFRSINEVKKGLQIEDAKLINKIMVSSLELMIYYK